MLDPLPPRPALSCFIVEDSPIIRQNLIATLEEMLPMQVVGTAEDAAGALQWMQAPGARCDLMIIDIFLKAGSGLGVLQQARQYHYGRHLVVLSNYATPEMRRRCAELGADRVFDKSSELEELIGYCETLMNPRAVPIISGLRNNSRLRAWRLVMRAPSEKCSRLLTANSATAAPKLAGPKASRASGRPMLPQLLNITTGTKVRGCAPNQRASGQASRPLPRISTVPPISSGT